MLVKRICKNCGKEFEIYESELKYGRGKYCSNKCRAEANRRENKVEPEFRYEYKASETKTIELTEDDYWKLKEIMARLRCETISEFIDKVANLTI